MFVTRWQLQDRAVSTGT